MEESKVPPDRVTPHRPGRLSPYQVQECGMQHVRVDWTRPADYNHSKLLHAWAGNSHIPSIGTRRTVAKSTYTSKMYCSCVATELPLLLYAFDKTVTKPRLYKKNDTSAPSCAHAVP
jgi:hypothetical protein